MGGTSHFDVEAFFGSVSGGDIQNVRSGEHEKVSGAYLAVSGPAGGDQAQKTFEAAWQRQEEKIIAAMKADPFGAKDVPPGDLHKIDNEEVRLDRQSLEHDVDLSARAHSMLKLFHNMRAALARSRSTAGESSAGFRPRTQ